jgi:phosphoribosylanthranilate isomerase
MSLKTNVLVTNITNLSEARYCAGMGVQYLAFDPTIIDTITYTDLTRWLKGPEFGLDISVLEYVPDNLNEFMHTFIIIRAEQLGEIGSNLTGKLFVKVSYSQATELAKRLAIDFFIPSEWSLIELKKAPINTLMPILAGQSIEEFKPFQFAGFILEGSSESKPGIFDYDQISNVLEKLEED